MNFSRKSAHVALKQANFGQEFDKCRWFGFQLIETLSSFFNFRLVLREIQLQRLFLVLVLVSVSPLLEVLFHSIDSFVSLVDFLRRV